jgi:hypothetical protein
MSVDEALMLIDAYHMEQDSLMPYDVESLIAKKKIGNKIKLFKHDPIFHGILRVTYDNLVISPRDSLHTKHYEESNYQASNSNIEKCYKELLEKEFKYAY